MCIICPAVTHYGKTQFLVQKLRSRQNDKMKVWFIAEFHVQMVYKESSVLGAKIQTIFGLELSFYHGVCQTCVQIKKVT